MFRLFLALAGANLKLNLLILALLVFSSVASSIPAIGGISGIISGYLLTYTMGALCRAVVEAGKPEAVKELLSRCTVAEILKKANAEATAGAYLGMLVNTTIITVSSVLFFALLTVPVFTVAILNPHHLAQRLSTGHAVLYLALALLITIYIALNFLFTASVAMARGLLCDSFADALVEALKGLTPRYFLLSLKPGLWRPSVAITLIALAAVAFSAAVAVIFRLAGIPLLLAFWAVFGVLLFHANVAYHYTCMKIMGLI